MWCCAAASCRVFSVQHLGRPQRRPHQLPGRSDTSTHNCGGAAAALRLYGVLRYLVALRELFNTLPTPPTVVLQCLTLQLCLCLLLLQLFRLWFSHPAVKGIIMWGWWDANIFSGNAGIYRADKQPKQAALAIRDLWGTELSTSVEVQQPQTGPSGWTQFSGYFGTYTFEYAAAEGRVVKGTVHLGRNSARQSLIQVL